MQVYVKKIRQEHSETIRP